MDQDSPRSRYGCQMAEEHHLSLTYFHMSSHPPTTPLQPAKTADNLAPIRAEKKVRHGSGLVRNSEHCPNSSDRTSHIRLAMGHDAANWFSHLPTAGGKIHPKPMLAPLGFWGQLMHGKMSVATSAAPRQKLRCLERGKTNNWQNVGTRMGTWYRWAMIRMLFLMLIFF